MRNLIILFLILIAPSNAIGLIEVDITRGNLNPLPIAVSPLSIDDESKKSFEKTLKKKDIGILITDHNVDETLSITDRSYLMFEGKLLKSGTSEELAADEQVRKLYLGQRFELKRKI